MAEVHVQNLKTQVNAAKTIADLIPIIDRFDITIFKNLLLSLIDDLDDSAARNTSFYALPMTDLLPEDLVQNITSFHHHPQIKVVSKG